MTTIFNPKVSIIIPVYNGSDYIREAIDSALSQTYKNLEIIVINDGSNDDGKTEKIAKSYGEKIRYFYKKNGGVATALNLGIQEMKGEYISWLSHDDVYYPHKLEVQINYLHYQKNKDIILYSDYEIIDERSQFMRCVRIPHIPPEKLLFTLLTDYPVHGCTVLIPKTCFEHIGLFDESQLTTQDYDFYFRAALRYPFIHLPQTLIKSREHPDQGTNLIVDHPSNCNTLYVRFLHELPVENIPALYHRSIAEYYLYLAAPAFKQRSLMDAYNCATNLGLQYLLQENIIRYIFTYSKIFFFKFIKRFLAILKRKQLFRKQFLITYCKNFSFMKKKRRETKRKSLKILFVAYQWHIHTARWINQLADQDWDLHLFSSVDVPWGKIHPLLQQSKITVHDAAPGGAAHTFWDRWKRRLILFFKRNNDRVTLLLKTIRKVQPDIVHSLETQDAGYLTLEAQKKYHKKFPIWLHTNWGSDIYFYQHIYEHRYKIKELLAHCDYYSCESQRDLALAKKYGYQGRIFPVFPNTGGFDLNYIDRLRKQGLSTSHRRVIMLKGYQNRFGRAFVGLHVLQRCIDLLRDYQIIVYSASDEVAVCAKALSGELGISIQTFLPYEKSHEEILQLHGQARISIGLNISDGVSTSFLEALVMGSFPIQSYTATADEWITDGETGLLVPPEDPEIIEKAVRKALIDDQLVDNAATQNWIVAQHRLEQNILRQKAIELYSSIVNSHDEMK